MLLNPTRLDRSARRSIAEALRTSDVFDVAARDGCTSLHESGGKPVGLAAGGQLRTVALLQDPIGQRLGLAVRRWLGLRAGPLDVLDAGAAAGRYQRGEADLLVLPLLTMPRGTLAALFRTGGAENFGGYSNAAVDAAFDAGDWALASALLAEDPPYVAICRPERIAIVDARFKKARVGPYGYLETLPDWEVAP